MTGKDRSEFVTIIISAGELYGKVPTDGAIALYWQALRSLSLDQLKTGISRHIADSERGQFMPKPADILRWFQRQQKPALIAWSEVEQTMARLGSYQTVQFEDGTTNAVIRDMGGWPWLCSQDIAEPWTQKEFERRYQAYQQRGIEWHGKLVGHIEQGNSAAGLLAWIPQTILIGEDGDHKLLDAGRPEQNDQDKALTVLIGDIGKID